MMIRKLNSRSGPILQLDENLLMENAEEFQKEFINIISNNPGDVLVDFSKISFIDSSGIGVLIKCYERLKAVNQGLNISGLSHNLQSVFKLSGLNNIITILTAKEAGEKYPDIFHDGRFSPEN